MRTKNVFKTFTLGRGNKGRGVFAQEMFPTIKLRITHIGKLSDADLNFILLFGSVKIILGTLQIEKTTHTYLAYKLHSTNKFKMDIINCY